MAATTGPGAAEGPADECYHRLSWDRGHCSFECAKGSGPGRRLCLRPRSRGWPLRFGWGGGHGTRPTGCIFQVRRFGALLDQVRGHERLLRSARPLDRAVKTIAPTHGLPITGVKATVTKVQAGLKAAALMPESGTNEKPLTGPEGSERRLDRGRLLAIAGYNILARTTLSR